jgi:DNA-binding response OmpR family regulator
MVAAQGDSGGVKVLVVDDDPTILRMVSTSLGKRNYQVITAVDGDTALAEARAQEPALIVLDVMMPGMSGWEVARELRRDPATKAIKILMLTAIGKDVNEMTSPLYGADAYLDKPFEFRELESTIAELLAG